MLISGGTIIEGFTVIDLASFKTTLLNNVKESKLSF